MSQRCYGRKLTCLSRIKKKLAELLIEVSRRNRFNASGRIFMTLQMSQTRTLIFLKLF